MQAKQTAVETEPILLRIDPDVTGITRLSRTTIYNEIAAGRLPVVRIGRSVRIRRADLDAWLDRIAGGRTGLKVA